MLGGFGTTCSPMVAPINGQLQYSTGSGFTTTYSEGATVTLICNANFQINGVSTSSCRGGSWYPPIGLCVGQGQSQNMLGGLGTSASVCALGMTTPVGRKTCATLDIQNIQPQISMFRWCWRHSSVFVRSGCWALSTRFDIFLIGL